jgi:hypothetical protein
VTFEGPDTSETATPSPFLDYRLQVTFTGPSGQVYDVPGFYAADGNAAETSATSGNKWRVHFTPDQAGTWQFVASFRTGSSVAISLSPSAGSATSFDGASGSFSVSTSNKGGADFRGKGMLEYVGQRYLRFAGNGEYFLKGGADSPENFLGYYEFDGTWDNGGKGILHKYGPHVGDWRSGDPTWQGGKGKGIIGALNYLGSQGVNSVYFLTYNIDGGDGRDTWPWVNPSNRKAFDVSKLDQWEIVFSHMDKLGIQLHVVTQEQENDQGLDGGSLGTIRKLYYRELVARFAHHPAVTWNLGEENSNTDSQRKQFASYIHALDPYDHPNVVHTWPGDYDKIYQPLLGFPLFEGPALQTNDTHFQTLRWVRRSADAGRPWIVTLDEIGPASVGVARDSDDPTHNRVRKDHLWGNLMAGGAGVEWYFGGEDQSLEDWRTRENMWELTLIARQFFINHLPFTQMLPNDGLTSQTNDYVLAKEGQVYAIYRIDGGTASLDLGSNTGTFQVRWYNPRTGGALSVGTVSQVSGPGVVSIGLPPNDSFRDWVALVRR